MKSKIKIYLAAAVIFLGSCNKQLNGLLNDPSSATPAAADVDLYLNNLQLNFKQFHQDISNLTDPLVRMEAMFGPTYFNNYGPTSFDGVWNESYMSIFLTADNMIPVAEAKNQFLHAGIAQALKAYTMITLVDCFGDIPYSEAVKGVANTNPKTDPGRQVYDSALALLDSAIANFGKTSSNSPTNDLFYAGSKANWTKFAKTMKLKAYVQTRLVDNTVAAKINALIAENDLINTTAQDFVFSYSTKAVSPDSRAPHYASNYGSNTGVSDYLGTYFMWCMNDEKAMKDPRTRYYLYRQIDDLTVGSSTRVKDVTTVQFAIPCLFRTSPYAAGVCYCTVDNSYLGRDHGNNEGAAPDGFLKTTWGLYPVGGEFDANQNKTAGTDGTQVKGAGGNGINPIWLSSFTYFLKAEAALTLGTTGDARALTVSGINQSMSKVSGFGTALGYTLPTTDTNMLITAYKTAKYDSLVTASWDAASSDGKLNILEKEYYLAAWGNGLEPFNNYRRTGKPSNMQPAVGNAGGFIRSFFYPSVYVNYNTNATQKSVVTNKVFWDTNPDNFVQ